MQSQNDGAIAQLVEQRTENPCVPGSIPGGTTAQKPQKISEAFSFYPPNLSTGEGKSICSGASAAVRYFDLYLLQLGAVAIMTIQVTIQVTMQVTMKVTMQVPKL